MADTNEFTNMDVATLRKEIADMVKDISNLKADKKEWVSGINESIRSIEKRLHAAVAVLKEKESAANSANLEAIADKILTLNTK
jgi:hypothetical protein